MHSITTSTLSSVPVCLILSQSSHLTPMLSVTFPPVNRSPVSLLSIPFPPVSFLLSHSLLFSSLLSPSFCLLPSCFFPPVSFLPSPSLPSPSLLLFSLLSTGTVRSNSYAEIIIPEQKQSCAPYCHMTIYTISVIQLLLDVSLS